MVRLPQGSKVIHDDKLCRVWRRPDGSCVAQGKRLSKEAQVACPLSLSERRMYVRELARSAIICKNLIQVRQCTLAEAWNMVKAARAPAFMVRADGSRRQLF